MAELRIKKKIPLAAGRDVSHLEPQPLLPSLSRHVEWLGGSLKWSVVLVCGRCGRRRGRRHGHGRGNCRS